MASPRDHLIFRPGDVDLGRSPLRRSLAAPTYVLGAFNPGLARLPSGNLLLMVRVAEALRDPVADGAVRAIRWTPEGYVLDAYPLADVDLGDPRQFEFKALPNRMMGLTSISWLLPVELTPDGAEVIAVHYDRAIEPAAAFQHYGIEDPRISRVEGRWYMTTCSVSAERLCSTLYTSDDLIGWRLEGIVLDHQNKDMVLFDGKVAGRFVALTRPMGDVYFVYPEATPWAGGPTIHLARSPDAIHWKPFDAPGIRTRKASHAARNGGGAPPVLTDAGWLALYHGVETADQVGIYRTYWALLDRDDPSVVLRQEDGAPLLEARPDLCREIAHQMYLPSPVVFTTGIVDAGDDWIVASGEADLACRITHLAKTRFA